MQVVLEQFTVDLCNGYVTQPKLLVVIPMDLAMVEEELALGFVIKLLTLWPAVQLVLNFNVTLLMPLTPVQLVVQFHQILLAPGFLLVLILHGQMELVMMEIVLQHKEDSIELLLQQDVPIQRSA